MKQRIITGVVGIIVAALVINMGGAVFAAAVTILALIAWKEYAAAFLNIDIHVSPKLGFLLVAALLG
ncbi:MAG: phosphatidate cytidylyltransferase, partial [Selenomonadaceae bacterium]|nr:phosphatidate cytidylyltransferase [Selenomonadaceae bacterium]